MTATSTGTAPISSAAWVTLVRVMPAFCTRTDPPYPSAPDASTSGVQASRKTPRREATASMIAAARPKRANVSQPGGSHARAIFDSGTVVPHRNPAAVRAGDGAPAIGVPHDSISPGACTEFVSSATW